MGKVVNLLPLERARNLIDEREGVRGEGDKKKRRLPQNQSHGRRGRLRKREMGRGGRW